MKTYWGYKVMAAELRATFVLSLRQLTENNSNDTYFIQCFLSAKHFTKVVRKAVIGIAATLCLSDLSTQETTNGAVLLHELLLPFEVTPCREVAAFHLEQNFRWEKSKVWKMRELEQSMATDSCRFLRAAWLSRSTYMMVWASTSSRYHGEVMQVMGEVLFCCGKWRHDWGISEGHACPWAQ